MEQRKKENEAHQKESDLFCGERHFSETNICG